MNVKRIFALLTAFLMLLPLFTGCSSDSPNKAGDSGSAAENSRQTDNPSETEIEKITYLARGNADNWNLAFENQDANLLKAYANMHIYGIEFDSSYCNDETYASVISSLAASGTLPEAFATYGAIDSSTIVEWIEQGMFLPCSEILSLSSGNMVKAFGDGGCYAWARAQAMTPDGDWYMVMITNSTARSTQIQESDGPLRITV